ncbi:MAG TPA: HAD family hydrolase [Phycicoccus sp.]|nr:HAD family hydrolase [Phycicoccus sp.]
MSSPPRATPALVATDLDGTFVRSDGSVSARSARVWQSLPDRGVETLIVTARPPRWLHDLEHVVGPRGVAICGNGAFVYDVGGRRLLDAHVFDAALLLALVEDLRAAIPGVFFAAERADGPYLEHGWPDPHSRSGADRVHRGHGAAIGDGQVGKLLALAPGIPVAEFFALVDAIVGERGHLAYSGAHGLAEINPRGVTKAVALEQWCGRLGIAAADVWAFGDMPNDLPMLRWAGVGYAVANAHPDVLAEADAVCPANDDDGVAATLEPYV